MKRRIFAVLLCVCIAVSLLPVVVLTGGATDSAETLMELDFETPDTYDSQSTLHPYGVDKNNFMMMAQNELYLYETANSGTVKSFYRYDTLMKLKNEGSALELTTSQGYLDCKVQSMNFSYVEAVPFDPSGSGRNDHIAFVGYIGDNGSNSNRITVWVLNTLTNQYSNPYYCGTAEWMADDFELYQAGNFFSITAGDYDGDGKDSIVVFVSSDTLPSTLEISYDAATKALAQRGNRRYTTVHKLYSSSVATWTDAKYDTHKWKLSADMVSGDFNGDGLDDLAVVSYTNNIDSGYEADLYRPYLGVFCGEKGQNVSNADVQFEKYLASGNITMAAPSLDMGDINGDGRPEIIVAGYYATVSPSSTNYERTLDDDNYLYAAYIGTSPKGAIENPTYMTIGITDSIKLRADMDDLAPAPISVACVAVNGPGFPEQVLVGHSLYSISGASATFLESIGDVSATISGQDVALTSRVGVRDMVSSVAVGNFDGNTVGREQVLLTVGIKMNITSRPYMHLLYAMGAATYGDNGMASSYFAKVRLQSSLNNMIDMTAKTLNFVAVAGDFDKDGVRARFSGNDYFYSDPSPVAVLQAAPYFGELGAWNDFQGATSYGYTQSYTFGSSNSESSSFSVGAIMEIDAEIAEMSVELGYMMDWNQTFERAQSTEYTTTFTAGPYDLVILTRTPVFTYYYDIYDNTNDRWIENALGISVPQTPRVYRLTIDEYNTYAAAYNQKLGEYKTDYDTEHGTDIAVNLLKTITDTRLHNE